MAFPAEQIFTKEILLQIRSYFIEFLPFFFQFEEAIFAETSISKFIRRENERNWRFFLCTHNSTHWKQMKKETGIWTLSSYYLKTFIYHPEFRVKVLNLAANYRGQIFPHTNPYANIPIFKSMITNQISTSLTFTEEVLDLGFSCGLLEELRIESNCEVLRLEHLGNLKKIECIHPPKAMLIAVFPLNLLNQIPLQNLQVLSFRIPPFVKPFELIDSNFPSLQKLKMITQSSEPYIISSIKLTNLQSLTLGNAVKIENMDECPQLTSLTLVRCSFDLSNTLAKQLRILHIDSAEVIIPWELMELDCLSLKNYFDFDVDYSFNIPTISIEYIYDIDYIILGNRVKNLKISDCELLTSIRNIPEDHQFEEVYLHRLPLEDFSLFTNTQKLFIHECHITKYPSSFEKIPYLSLENSSIGLFHQCPGISQQKFFLSLDSTNNEFLPLSPFSCIQCINISSIESITNIDCLIHVEILIAEKCHGLTEVNLIGENYRILKLNFCNHLYSLRLPTMQSKQKKLKQLEYYQTKLNEEDIKEFL